MATDSTSDRKAPAWYKEIPGRQFTKGPEGQAVSGSIRIQDSGFDLFTYMNGDKRITFSEELMTKDAGAEVLGSSVFPLNGWYWDKTDSAAEAPAASNEEVSPDDRNTIIADIRSAFKLWGPLPAVFEWDPVPTTGIRT